MQSNVLIAKTSVIELKNWEKQIDLIKFDVQSTIR